MQPPSCLDSDLVRIEKLGFRGEASAVDCVRRAPEPELRGLRAQSDGWRIAVEGGDSGCLTAQQPGNPGTTIDVTDSVLRRAGAAEVPEGRAGRGRRVLWTWSGGWRWRIRRSALMSSTTRAGARWPCLPAPTPPTGCATSWGWNFAANSREIQSHRDGMVLRGWAGLPTYNRANSVQQYLFVNGRPVRDKQLTGVIRAAYRPVLAPDRHPVVVLWLDVPAEAVGRERAPGEVRGPLPPRGRGPRPADRRLCGAGIVEAGFSGLQPPDRRGCRPAWPRAWSRLRRPAPNPVQAASRPARRLQLPGEATLLRRSRTAGTMPLPPARGSLTRRPSFEPEAAPEDRRAFPLGAAKAQMHANYIIAETEAGLVIVDQHAAHERLVLEKMKAQREAKRGRAPGAC